ncbi:hypothetical protein, partial [Pseudomonas sp. GL-B-19]|uniref:hypothetical protein n=1 Tax=Pseudomonas sp. GL-B-19 TaxID=2832393 RepID=UPI001CC09904
SIELELAGIGLSHHHAHLRFGRHHSALLMCPISLGQISLLAMAVGLSTKVLNVSPLSRAGSLLQGIGVSPKIG